MKEYRVETGRPSWHQAKAGQTCSGVIVCETREAAKAYLESFKRHHPDEPAWIVEREA